MGILGAVLPEDLQVVNGIKNALSLVVNFVAAVTFLVVRPEAVDWAVVGLIGVQKLRGVAGSVGLVHVVLCIAPGWWAGCQTPRSGEKRRPWRRAGNV